MYVVKKNDLKRSNRDITTSFPLQPRALHAITWRARNPWKEKRHCRKIISPWPSPLWRIDATHTHTQSLKGGALKAVRLVKSVLFFFSFLSPLFFFFVFFFFSFFSLASHATLVTQVARAPYAGAEDARRRRKRRVSGRMIGEEKRARDGVKLWGSCEGLIGCQELW